MSNQINTQDWIQVSFTKPKVQQKKTTITYTKPKLKVDEDGQEHIKVYKLNSNEIKEYTKYRVELKLSRADIAKKINCLQLDIDYLESGKKSSSQIGGKYKSYLKREHAKMLSQTITPIIPTNPTNPTKK